MEWLESIKVTHIQTHKTHSRTHIQTHTKAQKHAHAYFHLIRSLSLFFIMHVSLSRHG